VCGLVPQFARFSSGEVIEHMFEVMIEGLLPIPRSTGIDLKAPEPIHPSPYWADPPFIVKLRELGEKYRARTNKDHYYHGWKSALGWPI